MDTEIIKTLLDNGAFFTLFALLLYWLLTKYIPAREEEYKTNIQNIQRTFSESLQKIVDTYNNSTQEITKRLDAIETDIRDIRK